MSNIDRRRTVHLPGQGQEVLAAAAAVAAMLLTVVRLHLLHLPAIHSSLLPLAMVDLPPPLDEDTMSRPSIPILGPARPSTERQNRQPTIFFDTLSPWPRLCISSTSRKRLLSGIGPAG